MNIKKLSLQELKSKLSHYELKLRVSKEDNEDPKDISLLEEAVGYLKRAVEIKERTGIYFTGCFAR